MARWPLAWRTNVKPFDIGSVKKLTVSNVIIPRGMKIEELLNEK
jgi:hypothetical protein